MINFWSVLESVPRKNGADFGALGGSTGLFLALICSRFTMDFNLALGAEDNVNISEDNLLGTTAISFSSVIFLFFAAFSISAFSSSSSSGIICSSSSFCAFFFSVSKIPRPPLR